MHLNRAWIKNEILCEFLEPKKKLKENIVVISCFGAPSSPSKRNEEALFFSKKGYWYFTPRYRGTWESEGEFLKISPHLDVLDLMNSLSKGFEEVLTERKLKIKNPKFILIGNSFGGPAVILNSGDVRVIKVIAKSPVIDWTYPSRLEPLDKMNQITKDLFGQGYRLSKGGWNKLAKGNFYNPISSLDKIDSKKILIIHAQDDKVCSIIPVKKFVRKTGAKIKTFKHGGHSLNLFKPSIIKVVSDFIKS